MSVTTSRFLPASRGLFFSCLVLASAFVVFPSGGANAQTPVDEGTFYISVNGAPVGTEHFAIRRAGTSSDPQMIATAEITLTDSGSEVHLRPALQVAGGNMSVSAYQVKISGGVTEEVFVTVSEGRFLTRTLSERGERERELRAVPGTFLLDLDVAHHYYFLAAGARAGSVAVIVPREGRQHELALTEVGQEAVQVAGRSVDARHLRLGSGADAREIWVDGTGRVLRVDHPASGYSAVRTAAP